MKINTKILSLLIILAIVSISAVSAEDVTTDINVATPIDDTVVVEASSDADDVLATSHDIPANATVSEIETILASTSAGDTINFAKNAIYDFGSLKSGVKITHTLILQGNNASIKGYQGFHIEGEDESVAGTQVYNLNFEMTDPVKWNGRALEIEGGGDYIIANCTFKNGNAGVRLSGSTNVTISNNIFEGATNSSTIGKKEKGTKSIGLMGGSNFYITNNYFKEDILDAVSIASGAVNVEMYENVIDSVWYGVYYGGGVTNITSARNTFINNKVYALGIIKAAGNSEIYDNTFKTEENSTAIYVEEGNTAHGYPSNIETITILIIYSMVKIQLLSKLKVKEV